MADYNAFAGDDLGRIAALSDGIFAVAMTLLVLEIRVPDHADIASEGQLANALLELAPRALTWLLSMMTLGIFWVGQQTQLNRLERTDRNLSWLHYLFLATICALPFSTRLLGDYLQFRVAFVVYWANILLCGAALYATLSYANRARLLTQETDDEVVAAMCRRIIRAQTLYAVGAAIGLVYVVAGIVVIIAIQLNYAVAPNWTRRWT